MKKYFVLICVFLLLFQEAPAWGKKTTNKQPSTVSEKTTKAEKKANEAKQAAEAAKINAENSIKDTESAKAESDAKKAKSDAAKAAKAAKEAEKQAADAALKAAKKGTEEARQAQERAERAAREADAAAREAQLASDEADAALERFKQKKKLQDESEQDLADSEYLYELEKKLLEEAMEADSEYQEAWQEYLEAKEELESIISELENDRENITDEEYKSIIEDFFEKEQIALEEYHNAEIKAEATIDAYEKLGEFYKEYGYVGDPVFVGTGDYTAEYDDFIAEDYLDVFKVHRSFRNDGYAESFGLNWICSLDSRIIRSNYQDWTHKKELIIRIIEKTIKMREVFETYNSNYPDYPRSETEEYLAYADSVNSTMKKELALVEKIISDWNDINIKNEYCSYGRYKEPKSYYGYHNQLVYIDESGRRYNFMYAGDGEWVIPGNLNKENIRIRNLNKEGYLSNTDDNSGGYEVIFSNGNHIFYDEFGIMSKKIDRNGNSILYISDKGLINQIQTKTGEVISVKRNDKNFIISISGETSGKASFEYKDNQLIYIKNNRDTILNYEYIEGNISIIKKSDDSKVELEYEYNNILNKYVCTSVLDENGNKESFDYDVENKTVIHNTPDNKQEIYRLSSFNNPIYIKDAYKNETKFEIDEYGLILSVENNNVKKKFAYDDLFRPVTIEYENGGVTKLFYGEGINQNNIEKIVDADGFSKVYEYDLYGNLVKECLNNSIITSNEYYQNGLLKRTESCNNIIEYEYNKYGSVLTRNETCNGIPGVTYSFEYDDRNRLVRVYDGSNYTIYEYENGNRVEKTAKRINEYCYDSRRNLIKTVCKDLITGKTNTEEYTYDGCGNIRCIFSDGQLYKEIGYTYDGKVCEETIWTLPDERQIIDKFGIKTEALYDEKGFIYKKKKTLITKNETENTELCMPVDDKLWEKSFSAIENNTGTSITFNNKNGLNVNNNYDKCGRLIKQSYPDGYFIKYIYSKAGRLVYKIDSENTKWDYVYKSDGGWEENVSTPLGNLSKSVYDRYGRVISVNDSLLGRYFYSYWKDKIVEIKAPGYIKKNEYDDYGRLCKSYIMETYLPQKVMLYPAYKNSLDFRVEYEDKENKVSIFGGNASESYKEYFFDGNGNIIELIDRNGESHFEYDGLGRKIKKIDGKKSEYNYIYDPNNNVCCVLYPDNSQRIITHTLDGKVLSVMENGHILQSTDYNYDNRKISFTDCFGNTNSFLYDERGCITKEELSKSGCFDYSEFKVSLENPFDDNEILKNSIGKICFIKNDACNLEYCYDETGNLLEVHDLNMQIDAFYQYDRFGRCIYREIDNNQYYIDYDECGLIKSIYSRNGDISVDYQYDVYGRKTEIEYWNGITEKISYNDYGLIESRVIGDSIGQILYCELLLYDDQGRLIYNLDKEGTYTHYLYNEKGQLKQIEYPFSDEIKKFNLEEAEDCGSPLELKSETIIKYLDNSIYKEFLSLLDKNKLSGRIKIEDYLPVWKEEYSYTEGGAVYSIKNNIGQFIYEYDKNNRLIGKYLYGFPENKMKLKWNEKGNLISIEGKYSSISMEYSANNRIERYFSENRKTGEVHQVEYLYDSLNRRCRENYNDGSSVYYFYEGLSNKIELKVPAYGNNKAVTSYSGNITTEYAGSKFRYFEDDNYETYHDQKYQQYEKFGDIYSDKNNYVFYLFGGIENSVVNVNNNVILELNNQLNQNKSIIDGDNLYSSGQYDVYGNNYSNSYNLTDLPIDMGKRDYIPILKTFTSEDPTRDGINWYTYCSGDPINYIDISGYSIIPVPQRYLMTDYYYEDIITGNSTDSADGINKVGCYVTCYANALCELYEMGVVNEDKVKYTSVYGVNGEKDLFSTSPNHEADLIRDVSMNEVFNSSNNNADVSWDYFTEKVSDEMRLKVELAKADALKNDYVIMGVFDLSEVYSNVPNHMVIINDNFDENGVFNDITYSSKYDEIRKEQTPDVYCVDNLKEIRLIQVEKKCNE